MIVFGEVAVPRALDLLSSEPVGCLLAEASMTVEAMIRVIRARRAREREKNKYNHTMLREKLVANV